MNAKKALKRWIPLALWMALIFAMSSIPHLPGDYDMLPQGSDKVAHFIEYMVLALLLYRGIRGEGGVGTGPILVLLILIGFMVGGLDELYQKLVPGRSSSLSDLAADLSGVAAGTLLIFFKTRRSAAGVDPA